MLVTIFTQKNSLVRANYRTKATGPSYINTAHPANPSITSDVTTADVQVTHGYLFLTYRNTTSYSITRQFKSAYMKNQRYHRWRRTSLKVISSVRCAKNSADQSPPWRMICWTFGDNLPKWLSMSHSSSSSGRFSSFSNYPSPEDASLDM